MINYKNHVKVSVSVQLPFLFNAMCFLVITTDHFKWIYPPVALSSVDQSYDNYINRKCHLKIFVFHYLLRPTHNFPCIYCQNIPAKVGKHPVNKILIDCLGINQMILTSLLQGKGSQYPSQDILYVTKADDNNYGNSSEVRVKYDSHVSSEGKCLGGCLSLLRPIITK